VGADVNSCLVELFTDDAQLFRDQSGADGPEGALMFLEGGKAALRKDAPRTGRPRPCRPSLWSMPWARDPGESGPTSLIAVAARYCLPLD
jgi:hypothetical protein